MDFLDFLDTLPCITWTTLDSHPFSGLEYQEAETSRGTIARIMQGGYEVAGPYEDTEATRKQYMGRVERYINPA